MRQPSKEKLNWFLRMIFRFFGVVRIFPQKEVEAMIKEISQSIADFLQSHQDQEVCFVVIKEGGLYFAGKLFDLLSSTLRIDKDYLRKNTLEIQARSYGSTTEPSAVLLISKPNSVPNDLHNKKLQGKAIIIIEDIIDTGRTFQRLISYLNQYQPMAIYYSVLFNKLAGRTVEVEIGQIGGSLTYGGRLFLVGCGLDFCGKLRGLPDVYGIKESKFHFLKILDNLLFRMLVPDIKSCRIIF